jgi:PRC-barrel domain
MMMGIGIPNSHNRIAPTAAFSLLRLPQNGGTSDNKIGGVDDILIDKEGRVTAVIIGVGGFLGMGEKDVAVPFSSDRASEKNNKMVIGSQHEQGGFEDCSRVHL